MKCCKVFASILIVLVIALNLLMYDGTYFKGARTPDKGEFSYYKAVGTISRNEDGTLDIDYISNVYSVTVFMTECANEGYIGVAYKLNPWNRGIGMKSFEMQYHVFFISDGVNQHYGIIHKDANKIEGEKVIWATK